MRTKNVGYSLLTSLIYQVLYSVMNFVTISIFLKTFGSEINGLTMTVIQIVNYLNIVEAGIAIASISQLYKPLASNNVDKVNNILSASNILFRKSGVFFVIVVILAAIIYPNIITTSIPKIEISLLIMVMSLGSIIEFFLHGKMRVLLVSDQKSYIINLIMIISMVFANVLKITAIYMGFDFLIVQLVFNSGVIIKLFLTTKYISYKYPEINFKATPDFTSLNNRWAVFYHQIAGLIVFNSPIIVVSIFSSLQDASIYSIYNLIFNSIILILTMFSKSVIASLGNLLNNGSHNYVIRTFQKYEYTFVMFASFLYTLTFILFQSFLELFTKGVNDTKYFDQQLLILFIIIGLLNAYRIPLNSLIEASGHYKETQHKALIEAIINMSMSLILVQFIGIYGVLIASILSYSYRTIDTILYSNKKILKINPFSSIKITIVSIISIVSLIYIHTQFVNLIIDSWMQWLLYSLLFSLFYGFIYLALLEILCKGFLNEIFKRIKILIR